MIEENQENNHIVSEVLAGRIESELNEKKHFAENLVEELKSDEEKNIGSYSVK